MIREMVICGASLPDGICSGIEPPEEWRETVNEAFVESDVNYRLLPAVEHEGTDEEVDNREDGTYEQLPASMELGEYTVRGAIICNGCYVTLSMLSPSGQGLRHELARAVTKARSMDPSELPRLGVKT